MKQTQTHTAEAGDVTTSYQSRVDAWLIACFGETIARDRQERNHRFLEEALELVQACECTAGEAHQLVDYVFGRPIGDPRQESGGVSNTHAALCLAQGIDMEAAAEAELARVWTKVEKIRAKQAAKPKHSPLPEASPAPRAPEVPEGAIHNGRECLRRLVEHYHFEDDGHPLRMCSEYDDAVRCFEVLADTIAAAPAAPPADGGTSGLNIARSNLAVAIGRIGTVPSEEQQEKLYDAFCLYTEAVTAALSSRTPAGAAGDPVGERIRAFAKAILHGDDDHREWLLEAAEAFVTGTKLPEPRGKGTATRPASPAPAASAEIARWLQDRIVAAEQARDAYPDNSEKGAVLDGAIGALASVITFVRSAPDAALAPAAQVNPGREEIARIIDPEAHAGWHARLASQMKRQTAATARTAADYYYPEWNAALAKADAILAARPVAEGDAAQTQAAADVLAERRRQVEAEGWTPEHDDEHSRGEIARAACSYAYEAGRTGQQRSDSIGSAPPMWPWDLAWWKPTDPRRDLVKAGALILAEIERLDRPAARPAPSPAKGGTV